MNLTENYRQRVWWAVRPLWLWRVLRLALRGLWIAGVIVVAAWLATSAGGVPVALGTWLPAGLIVFLIAFCVLAFWPVSFSGLLGRLDRALALHDQLGTAYEVAARGPQNYLEARLMKSASGSLAQAQRKFWRSPAIPWADLELCALVAIIIYALFANLGALGATLLPDQPEPLPALGAEPQVPLPGLPPELQRAPAPFGGEQPGPGEGPGADPAAAQEALDALAEALSEQSITQSAGAALAAGNGDQAAERLRELAEAAEQISPEALEQLGDSLQEAADQIEGSAPEAAQELGQSARGLQSGDPTASTEALDNLARMIEDLRQQAAEGSAAGEGQQSGQSDQPGSGGAGLGSTAGRETQPEGSTEHLNDDPETVELPQSELDPDEDAVLMPPQNDESGDAPRRSTPYTQVGPNGTSVGQVSDPLTYPWRLRNVVQQYFSPP